MKCFEKESFEAEEPLELSLCDDRVSDQNSPPAAFYSFASFYLFNRNFSDEICWLAGSPAIQIGEITAELNLTRPVLFLIQPIEIFS